MSPVMLVRSGVQLIDPVEFLQPGRRLFIDTNIFMDADSRRSGGLKRLFMRGQDAIIRNSNPIVVPTKVVDELTKQSRLDPSRESEERAASIRKAGDSLAFLDSASRVGLIRKDLGDDTNPYADDLFLRIFESYAGTYEMCLLTYDITIQLRIRLLAHRTGRRLLAGILTKDGDLKIDSDESLFQRGQRKHVKFAERVAAGGGSDKDRSEAAMLKSLLDELGKALGMDATDVKVTGRAAKWSAPGRRPAGTPQPAAFSPNARIKPPDAPLAFTSLPRNGDSVAWESAHGRGSTVLGTLLGEGGEGAVYEVSGNRVVKIFDKNHLTSHRQEKVKLLVSRGIEAKGLCIPSALVRNQSGEFVGYVMPKASGREFQRTIFNRRKFEKEFPNWKKADLVDICISFLEKVEYLHSNNIILGDINPKNLMVDDKKNVFIIDADSWQLEGYPCPVGTPMFTSPAMLGKTYAKDLRTMDDELFAVATMLFMIVMTGQFPYIRTGTDGDMVRLIKEGNFAFQYENRNNKDQPDGDWKYMWSHIHKPVKDLFWHTFHKEGKRYKKRPTASEWLAAFRAYKSYLGDKRDNFDPMSNDVYPIRPKAFRPDTPIRDCRSCGRKNAIAGIWRDFEQEYFVPPSCLKCRDAQPPRQAASQPPRQAASQPPRQAASQPPRQAASRQAAPPTTYLCWDCRASYPKSQLEYGRCPACARREDPTRLCQRCGKPFISYGNVEWHKHTGKPIPTTHKRGVSGTYPAVCTPSRVPTRPAPAGTRAAQTTTSTQAKPGLWARIKSWFMDY